MSSNGSQQKPKNKRPAQRTVYRVTVRGTIPDDLVDRVSVAHAHANSRSGTSMEPTMPDRAEVAAAAD